MSDNYMDDIKTPEEIREAIKTIRWAAKNLPDVLERAYSSSGGTMRLQKNDELNQIARDIVKSVNAPDHEKIGARIADQITKGMEDESHEKAASDIVKAVS